MKRLPAILLLVLLLAFAAGLLALFKVRFARGDLYPPASTFRADPLGARAFHDSLARFTDVRRHLRSLAALGEGRDATLFFLGAERSDLRLPADEFKHLEAFVADGGRLVIALRPDPGSRFERFLDKLDELDPDASPKRGKTGSRTNQPAAKKLRPRPSGDDAERAESSRTSLEQRWDFLLESPPPRDTEEELPKLTVRRRGNVALPPELTWHSPAWYRTTNPAWHTLYTRDQDRPVALERRLGRGSVVLLTDSWHFTNEALRDDRQSAWLAWLVGPQRRVIFDETHLGISESPGVAALARRYRLHGVFAALIVLAGLFIWRNSTSFPPAEPEPARAADSAVPGREAAAGFVSLLRRNLPVSGLAEVCFAEWRKSCAHSTPPARLHAVEAAFAAEAAHSTSGKGVTALYHKLSQILKRSAFKP